MKRKSAPSNPVSLSVKDKTKSRGQGIVEFALALPIFLVLVFGIIEFGRLLFTYAMVSSASREAARYGSAAGYLGGVLRFQDCQGIEAAALRIGGIVGVDASGIKIEYTKYDYDHDDNPDTAAITQTFEGCPPTVPISLADRILVTVTREFQPIAILVNIPSIDISTTTARTIVRNVIID